MNRKSSKMVGRALLTISFLLLTMSVAYADTVSVFDFTGTAESAITRNTPSGTGGGPSLNNTTTYDGTARLFIDTNNDHVYDSGCSGSLLWTRRDVLTAAHCVSAMLSSGGSLRADFLNGVTQSFTSSSAVVFAGYSGAVQDSRDLAIVHLGSTVNGVAAYDIYRTFGGEYQQTINLVGYGVAGDGTGWNGSEGFGNRRTQDNRVDGFWGGLPGGFNELAMDFDSGLAANDVFGRCFGTPQTGVPNEGMFIFGDSGGPSLLSGRIAGVHSWIGSEGPDCGDNWSGPNGTINGSWGEYGGDVMVSQFTQWVDANVTPTTPTPEPASALLLGLGLAAVAIRKRFGR